MKKGLIGLLLAMVITSLSYGQSLVISVKDIDTISREVQSFSRGAAMSCQNKNYRCCIIYGYGKASDGKGFYRYYAYSTQDRGAKRDSDILKVREKLMGFGAMDPRLYQISTGHYVEISQ
jgi:hypothetical protein